MVVSNAVDPGSPPSIANSQIRHMNLASAPQAEGEIKAKSMSSKICRKGPVSSIAFGMRKALMAEQRGDLGVALGYQTPATG